MTAARWLLIVALTFSRGAAAKVDEQTEFLITMGYFTGAADACRVAVDASKLMHDFMNLAIANGNYGNRFEARRFYENGRRLGIGDGAKPATDCATVGKQMRAIPKAFFKN